MKNGKNKKQEQGGHDDITQQAAMSPSYLNDAFEKTYTENKDFSEWTKGIWYEVPDDLIAQHRSGIQPITLGWAILYKAFLDMSLEWRIKKMSIEEKSGMIAKLTMLESEMMEEDGHALGSGEDDTESDSSEIPFRWGMPFLIEDVTQD